MKRKTNIRALVAVLLWVIFASRGFGFDLLQEPDSIPPQASDSVALDSVPDTPAAYEPTSTPTYEPAYRFGDPISNRNSSSPLLLDDPSSLDFEVEYDSGFRYSIYERIGDLDFRPATSMSFQEYDQ